MGQGKDSLTTAKEDNSNNNNGDKKNIQNKGIHRAILTAR